MTITLAGRTLTIEAVANVPEIAIHIGKDHNPYAPLADDRALVERLDGAFVKVCGYEGSNHVTQCGGIEQFARGLITKLQCRADTADYQLVDLADTAEAARDAKREKLAALAEPDCERCEGSGLDPDRFTTTRRADGQTVYHLTEPCTDCIDEVDATGL